MGWKTAEEAKGGLKQLKKAFYSEDFPQPENYDFKIVKITIKEEEIN